MRRILPARAILAALAVAAGLPLAGCYTSFERVGDATVDPPVDTHADDPVPGDCTPGDPPPGCEPTAGGECNVVDQCGCCGGECSFDFDWDTCEFSESCGGMDLGCDTPGWIYMIYPPDTSVGRCFEWCYDDSDCSLVGEWCNLPAKFDEAHPPCDHVDEFPVMLCSDGTYG